jgi:hypothetical protein
VIVNAGVQARLGAIDARAKLAAKRATRKQGNDPSFPQVQQPQFSTLTKRHAVYPVRTRAHHVSLGRKARTSRDDTAPSS